MAFYLLSSILIGIFPLFIRRVPNLLTPTCDVINGWPHSTHPWNPYPQVPTETCKILHSRSVLILHHNRESDEKQSHSINFCLHLEKTGTCWIYLHPIQKEAIFVLIYSIITLQRNMKDNIFYKWQPNHITCGLIYHKYIFILTIVTISSATFIMFYLCSCEIFRRP